MTKKKNTKFRISDLVIILLCLGGAAASGTAFWQEYNRTLSRLNEEPVGTIVFKKRVAQRKFVDRVVWDRLKQTSSIYNGDTIRTVEQSEASIRFQNQVTNLRLDANTLMQIFWDQADGARLDLNGGNLEVLSSEPRLAISSGGSEIRIEGHGRIKKNDEGISLAVLEGRADFGGTTVEEGGILALNTNGTVNTNPMIAMTSFGDSARVLGAAQGSSPIDFSWNTANFNPDTHVIVEVARDRNFRNMIDARDIAPETSTSIPLENGNYFWRAFAAHGGSAEAANSVYPSGTLEVIPASPITLLFPARAAEFIFADEPVINLSWTETEGAEGYLVEISSNANMSSPVVSRRVDTTQVAQTGLEPGRWYWRVTPVFSMWVKGSISPSETRDFSVEQGLPVLAEPSLTFPAQNGSVYVESASWYLLWRHDPAALSWLVEVADNSAMANPVVQEEVSFNYYELPKAMIETGKTWYWRISATGGAAPAVSTVRNFAVSDGSKPSAAPEIAAVPRPAAAAIPEPEVTPEPVPAAGVTPEPEPAPAARVTPPPAAAPPRPAPPARVTPPVVPAALPARPVRDWSALAPGSTVYGCFPPDGYTVTTGQLADARQVHFNWQGRASEYRYALYRVNGDTVVGPSLIDSASFTLPRPETLTEGEYVWQVFERNREENWETLPSASNRLIVTGGPAALKTLQSRDPGVLYGNP